MNRVINIFTFLTLGIFCLMVMIVVYDLSMSNLHLKGMPYQREIFTGMAMLVLILGLIRMQRRWQGMRDMKRYSSFKFTAPVAKKHRMMGVIVTLIEVVFFTGGILVCSLFLDLEPTFVMPMILVLALLIFESLIFTFRLLKAGKSFVLGLNDDVIAYFDREMHLFYYTGLQKVELYQKDLINLGYRDDLNLSIETGVLSGSDRKTFRDTLIETLESKNVFVDDSLRNWQ
jgi:hypothetical protein